MDMKGFASLKLDNYLQKMLDLIGSDYKNPSKFSKICVEQVKNSREIKIYVYAKQQT